MPRSSIFSFERPVGQFRPFGLLFALVLLLAFEVTVSRREAVWSAIPRSEVGIVDVVERIVIAPAEDPRILVFGNSRARDGLAPRQLEAALALPSGSVLNLALTRGTAFDARALYERNADVLADAEVVFFGVDVIQFDGTLEPSERVRRFASLAERFELPPAVRGELLAGWAWRTYDARDAIRRGIKAWVVDGADGVPLAPDGRVQWRTAETNDRAERVSMTHYAKHHLATFERHEPYVKHVDELVARLESAGHRVVLFEVPFRAGYVRVARRDQAPGWSAYEQILEELGSRHEMWRWQSRKAGLRGNHYFDYGHLKPAGTRRFTRVFADRVKREMASIPRKSRP